MYWRGHVGAALLVVSPLGGWLASRGYFDLAFTACIVAVGLSTLPDLDERLSIPHRGPTHTVWFGLGIGVFAFVIGWIGGAILGNRPVVLGGVFGVAAGLAVCSHLVADVVTPMGIQPWKPLSDRHYSLGLTPARNPRANRLLLGVGTGAALFSYVFVMALY